MESSMIEQGDRRRRSVRRARKTDTATTGRKRRSGTLSLDSFWAVIDAPQQRADD